jgi:hypothetical protein
MASYNTGISCPGEQTNKQGELHSVTEVDISFSVPCLMSLRIRSATSIYKLLYLIYYTTIFKWQKKVQVVFK